MQQKILSLRTVKSLQRPLTLNVEFLPYQCGRIASGVVYDLLVGHEVGHALYTPADNWTIDYPDVPMSYVNVLEDVRIEKFMKQRYPGLSKTFYNGYSQLAEQDFFELDQHDLE